MILNIILVGNRPFEQALNLYLHVCGYRERNHTKPQNSNELDLPSVLCLLSLILGNDRKSATSYISGIDQILRRVNDVNTGVRRIFPGGGQQRINFNLHNSETLRN